MNDKERDQLLLLWMDAQKDLARAQTVERELRQKIASALFADPKEGMNSYELGQGYTLKLDHKFSYKLTNNDKAGRLTEDALARLVAASPAGEGTLLGKRLVKWSPELSISEWRKLSDAQRACFTYGDVPALVISPPGLPTLKLETPKDKK